MNWHLAVEKNHEALRRILAMLVAMVGMTAAEAPNPNGGGRAKTLPRHLHRYVLRLLRPAEVRDAAADHHRRARAGGENPPASSAQAQAGA